MKDITFQARLNTRLFLVLVGLGLVFGIPLHYYMNRLLEMEIEDKARLIFSNLMAVQTYVRETLRPAMYETLPQEAFVIEAMSTSYITRKVMSDLNMSRDQFIYRRVASDPRNLQFGANDTEKIIIEHFKQNPAEPFYTRFFELNDEKRFIMARPVVFEKRCLVCHGHPDDAPGVMLERYGRERGFGRQEGEIGGLDSLIMPVERQANTIRKLTISFILAFTCGTLIILGINHFFFDRIMIFNIARMADLMRSRFPDEADRTMPKNSHQKDEIEAMIGDMERFADHLSMVKAILETIFEGIADPLFLINSAQEIVHTNSAGHSLMRDIENRGLSMKQMMGFSDTSTDRREVLLPDGRSFHLRFYPVSGSGQMIVYARDNTMEKTMLAKLQQNEKAMAIESLAGGLAHEINNPLGVILCYARLLHDDGKSDRAEDLNIIIRHTLQAQKILEDLMRFARPKTEATGVVDLTEAVRFIVRVFQMKAAKQGAVIESNIEHGLPAIRGNASAIEQILANILLNALDALEEAGNKPEGRIIISGSFDSLTNEVLLQISDNGPGIPEENLNRVFDPFFTTKAVGRGTGLGLSIVYGLVRDLEGRISIRNQNGAVFNIYFQAESNANV